METKSRCPAMFVGHGAAVLTTSPSDATHGFLAGFAATVDAWRPRAIVVVSAHYIASPLRVTGPGDLATIHDHPARTVYGYRYPGRGDEALTRRLLDTLDASGSAGAIDAGRGLDNGAWVPLSLLRPGGDLPVAQVSLPARLDVAESVALGSALSVLRSEGVLLLGSGGLTHHQGVFREGYFAGSDPNEAPAFSRAFDAWASSSVTSTRGRARVEALAAFEAQSDARLAHPTIEHFLPLLVLAGAAGDDAATKVFEGYQHGLSTSAIRFG